MIDYVAKFIFFFSVIDPIGTVPVFIAVTKGYELAERKKIALRATLVSAVVLVGFVVVGELVLRAMSIPLSAFQTAGGIVLFLFALTMIFGESKPEEEVRMAKKGDETAVFPLAVPSIAGPGAMLAAVLQTEKHRFDLLEQTQITLIMLFVLLITFVLMLGANFAHRFLGNSGASVISRVMGLILASVAVSNVLSGIRVYFSI